MYTRRAFLKDVLNHSMAMPLMMSGTSILSSLSSINAQATETDDYRALVCVFLFGGMDCHDTLIPFDEFSYNNFVNARSTLFDSYNALPNGSTRTRDRLLGLNPARSFGERQFALPPELSGLHSLFEGGKAAIAGNVGPLIEPTNRDSYFDKTATLPSRLFSHNDQQSTWMAFAPEGSAKYGWGGQFGDNLMDRNLESVFGQISLYGNTVFLTGDNVQAYQVGTEGVPSIGVIDESTEDLSAILRDHFASEGDIRENLFERDFINISRRSLDANDLLTSALDTASSLTTQFPPTRLGAQLKTVAETLSIRGTLGANRQIFFAGLGGFDTHSAQALKLPELQQELSDAIAALYAATEELGIEQEVTTFTAADFGRTLTANGDGTDHGWGGHHFIVGGAVNGGDIFGEIPESTLGHSQDAGNGRLIPTSSVEQFAAPLGQWFGLNEAELNLALPGFKNFPEGAMGFLT